MNALNIDRLALLAMIACLTLGHTACGDDDGGGAATGPLAGLPTFPCESPPPCYVDALAAIRACLSDTALVSSGDSMDMTCAAGEVSVALSAFNDRPTGLVPTPSSATISTTGTECGTLSWGDGVHTDGPTGVSTAFDFAELETNGQVVTIRRWATGDASVACGADTFVATATALEGCSGGLLYPLFRRADDLSVGVGVVLEAGDGSREDLFTCQ